MVLVPKTNGEGKRPLPSPWFWCQKHTPSVALTIVFVPKTHGQGKRPLPSPWFWCQEHTVKASASWKIYIFLMWHHILIQEGSQNGTTMEGYELGARAPCHPKRENEIQDLRALWGSTALAAAIKSGNALGLLPQAMALPLAMGRKPIMPPTRPGVSIKHIFILSIIEQLINCFRLLLVGSMGLWIQNAIPIQCDKGIYLH